MPLDHGGRAGGKLGFDFGHFRPHIVQRLDHIGAGGEIDFDFARAAHRFRLQAAHAGHDAHALLDRPSDDGFDIANSQRRRFDDHGDLRKRNLRINAAGHVQHRHHAPGHQQQRGDDDQPEIGPGKGDQISARDELRWRRDLPLAYVRQRRCNAASDNALIGGGSTNRQIGRFRWFILATFARWNHNAHDGSPCTAALDFGSDLGR